MQASAAIHEFLDEFKSMLLPSAVCILIYMVLVTETIEPRNSPARSECTLSVTESNRWENKTVERCKT